MTSKIKAFHSTIQFFHRHRQSRVSQPGCTIMFQVLLYQTKLKKACGRVICYSHTYVTSSLEFFFFIYFFYSLNSVNSGIVSKFPMYHVLCQFFRKRSNGIQTIHKSTTTRRQKRKSEKKVKLKQNTNLKSMLLLILGN